MIHNLIRAAHELIFNRRISNMNSNTVQGAIDELKGTLGYTKKNHFKYITDGFEYNGIVTQKNADGSMSVTGTATDTVDYQIGETIAPDNEQYILSGYTEGADADCNIYAAYWEDASTWLSAEAVLDDKGVLVTKAKGNLCNVCLHVAKGKTVNIKFYPMVRYASIEDGTYEPYVEDVQTRLTTVQTINLRTGATLYVYGKIAILILDGVVINSENTLLISDEKYKPIQDLVRSWCRYDSNSGLKYHAQFGIYNNGHMTCTSIATDGSSTSVNNGKVYGQAMFNIK